MKPRECLPSGWLLAPVDIASLAFFRIVFGVVMAWEVARYFGHGWIARYYIRPTFHFAYYGFEWVRPWAEDGMYVHFLLLGVLSFLITSASEKPPIEPD